MSYFVKEGTHFHCLGILYSSYIGLLMKIIYFFKLKLIKQNVIILFSTTSQGCAVSWTFTEKPCATTLKLPCRKLIFNMSSIIICGNQDELNNSKTDDLRKILRVWIIIWEDLEFGKTPSLPMEASINSLSSSFLSIQMLEEIIY